jgi:hypothetical protein
MHAIFLAAAGLFFISMDPGAVRAGLLGLTRNPNTSVHSEQIRGPVLPGLGNSFAIKPSKTPLIDDQHVKPGLAVLDLLPQARRGGLGRSRPSSGRPEGKAHDQRQQSPKSERQIPHRCHLDQSVEFDDRL